MGLIEQFRPLGPGAAAWYVTSDLRGMLLAIRALVLQMAEEFPLYPERRAKAQAEVRA